jgi:hypothetical protein
MFLRSHPSSEVLRGISTPGRRGLCLINAQVSTNRRALPDGRLHGSYPETAVEEVIEANRRDT